ncbi:MAG: cupin domain-containing protein [Motiliproteus sp.]
MNNIFAAIPDDLSTEVFDTLLENDKVKIERIVSKGHSSPDNPTDHPTDHPIDKGWYDQSQHEWVIVLRGEAVIAFDNAADRTLAAGDYLHIPAHQKHKVSWTDPAVETVWLAIHY